MQCRIVATWCICSEVNRGYSHFSSQGVQFFPIITEYRICRSFALGCSELYYLELLNLLYSTGVSVITQVMKHVSAFFFSFSPFYCLSVDFKLASFQGIINIFCNDSIRFSSFIWRNCTYSDVLASRALCVILCKIGCLLVPLVVAA